MTEGGGFVPVKCVLVKCEIVKFTQNKASVTGDKAGELATKPGPLSIDPHLPESFSWLWVVLNHLVQPFNPLFINNSKVETLSTAEKLLL